MKISKKKKKKEKSLSTIVDDFQISSCKMRKKIYLTTYCRSPSKVLRGNLGQV